MKLFDSNLAKKILDGNLPEVKAQVSIEQKSLIDIGVLFMSVGVGIALLVVAVKKIS